MSEDQWIRLSRILCDDSFVLKAERCDPDLLKSTIIYHEDVVDNLISSQPYRGRGEDRPVDLQADTEHRLQIPHHESAPQTVHPSTNKPTQDPQTSPVQNQETRATQNTPASRDVLEENKSKTCVNLQAADQSFDIADHYLIKARLTQKIAKPSCHVFRRKTASRFLLLRFDKRCPDSLIERVLRTGLKVHQGQQAALYSFFGYTRNQIYSSEKECYLYDSTLGTREELLQEFADFQKIDSVSKRALRIGLLFSNVVCELPIMDEEIRIVDDVLRNGFNFTEGCGSISVDLAVELFRALGKKETEYKHQDPECPSVFQIRLKGYKGTVVVDKTLPSREIHIRKSMVKFEMNLVPPYILGFVSHGISWPYNYGHLNQQFITILSYLGIPDKIFLEKQKQYNEEIQTDFTQTPFLALKYLAMMSRQDLIEDFIASRRLSADAMCVLTKLRKRAFMLAKSSKHQDINYKYSKAGKLNFPIEDSRNVFGVCDISGTLKPGTCFFQPTILGTPKVINGDVIIVKSPCYYPGDLRKLKCVSNPYLHHLVDCVVFPTKGKRPVSDEISGSDLDGDKYFVCWDRDLIPVQTTSPMAYSAPPPESDSSSNDITKTEISSDMIAFFSSFNNEKIGKFDKNFHSVVSERGLGDPKTKLISSSYGGLIDSAKTGETEDKTFSSSKGQENNVSKNKAGNSSITSSENGLVDNSKSQDIADLLLNRAKIYIEKFYHADPDLKDSQYDGVHVSLPYNELVTFLSNKQLPLSDFEIFCIIFKWCTFHDQQDQLVDLCGRFVDFTRFTTYQKHLTVLDCSQLDPRTVFNGLSRSAVLSRNHGDKIKQYYPVSWVKMADFRDQGVNWNFLVEQLTLDRLVLLAFTIPREDGKVWNVAMLFPGFLQRNSATVSQMSAFLSLGEDDHSDVTSEYEVILYRDRLQMYPKGTDKQSTFINFMKSDSDDDETVVSIALQRFSRTLSEKHKDSRIRKDKIRKLEMFCGVMDVREGPVLYVTDAVPLSDRKFTDSFHKSPTPRTAVKVENSPGNALHITDGGDSLANNLGNQTKGPVLSKGPDETGFLTRKKVKRDLNQNVKITEQTCWTRKSAKGDNPSIRNNKGHSPAVDDVTKEESNQEHDATAEGFERVYKIIRSIEKLSEKGKENEEDGELEKVIGGKIRQLLLLMDESILEISQFIAKRLEYYVSRFEHLVLSPDDGYKVLIILVSSTTRRGMYVKVSRFLEELGERGIYLTVDHFLNFLDHLIYLENSNTELQHLLQECQLGLFPVSKDEFYTESARLYYLKWTSLLTYQAVKEASRCEMVKFMKSASRPSDEDIKDFERLLSSNATTSSTCQNSQVTKKYKQNNHRNQYRENPRNIARDKNLNNDQVVGNLGVLTAEASCDDKDGAVYLNTAIRQNSVPNYRQGSGVLLTSEDGLDSRRFYGDVISRSQTYMKVSINKLVDGRRHVRLVMKEDISGKIFQIHRFPSLQEYRLKMKCLRLVCCRDESSEAAGKVDGPPCELLQCCPIAPSIFPIQNRDCLPSNEDSFSVGISETNWFENSGTADNQEEFSKSCSVQEVPVDSFLDATQKEAVRAALDTRITLIHGAHGSGKTRTLVTIIESWRTKFPREDILVCCVTTSNMEDFRKLLVKRGVDESDMFDLREVDAMKKRAPTVNPQVVLCLYEDLLVTRNLRFQQVVLDDCCRVNEMFSVLPLFHGCRRVCFAGDKTDCVNDEGLDSTIYNRFQEEGRQFLYLSHQYRCDSRVWQFVQGKYYQGEIIHTNQFNSSNPRSLVFIDVVGQECCLTNEKEVDKAIQVAMDILNHGDVKVDNVTITTVHKQQLRCLEKQAKKKNKVVGRMEMKCLEELYGCERQAVIFSAVNTTGDFGGNYNITAIKTLLTMFTSRLVIVGNFEALVKTDLWQDLLVWMDKNNQVINYSEGWFNNNSKRESKNPQDHNQVQKPETNYKQVQKRETNYKQQTSTNSQSFNKSRAQRFQTTRQQPFNKSRTQRFHTDSKYPDNSSQKGSGGRTTSADQKCFRQSRGTQVRSSAETTPYPGRYSVTGQQDMHSNARSSSVKADIDNKDSRPATPRGKDSGTRREQAWGQDGSPKDSWNVVSSRQKKKRYKNEV